MDTTSGLGVASILCAGITVIAGHQRARTDAASTGIRPGAGVVVIAARPILHHVVLAALTSRDAKVEGARVLIVAARRAEPANARPDKGVADIVGAWIAVLAAPVLAASIGQGDVEGASVSVIAIPGLADTDPRLKVAMLVCPSVPVVTLRVRLTAALRVNAADRRITGVIGAWVAVVARERF